VCTAESKLKLWGCTSIGLVGHLEFDYIEPRVNTVRRIPEPVFQTPLRSPKRIPILVALVRVPTRNKNAQLASIAQTATALAKNTPTSEDGRRT
jgi:hypothetical protein